MGGVELVYLFMFLGPLAPPKKKQHYRLGGCTVALYPSPSPYRVPECPESKRGPAPPG